MPTAEARLAGGPVAGFTDVTRDSGISFRHFKGDFDPKLSNIMPWIQSIGAAACVSDYDRDGDLDLYVTSSRKGTPNALWRNDGGLKFVDVAREAHVADVNDSDGVSMDAAFADLDRDGDDELYVVEWGKNRLFRNDSNGRFSEITDVSGTGDRSNGNAVLPFDYNLDGLTDLYVCNYFPSVDLANLSTTRIMHDSFEAARNGGANVLYKNLGGLKFENVAHELNVDDTGWSLDAGISDIDNDSDLDLYVANDFGQDRLYLASGDGHFTDVTERAIGHETFKGMNIDFGDFDGDGYTDGYVANITTAEYLKEGNMLLLNGGNGTFSNVASATGTFDGGWGWCARFFDFDQDGHLDLFALNGFVSAGPQIYWEDLANIAVDPGFDPAESTQWPAMGNRSLSGHEPNRLFRNRGDGSFEEVAQKYGLADKRDARGIALADFDDDGDLDVYVANQGAPGALYRNDVGNMHRFLDLELEGRRTNPNAIGARVQVTAAGSSGGAPLRLTREVNGGNGFASQSAYGLHFGLGQSDRIEKVTVFWPSGIVQEVAGLSVDRRYRVVETGEVMAPDARRALYFGQPKSATAPGTSVASAGASAIAVPSAVLLDLEEKLRRRPCNVGFANAYRALCVDSRQLDRSIELFRGLVRSHAEHGGVRIQLALAIVDKIPSLDGDVLGQGSLAKESLNELAWVEERDPGSYALHYIAGMNHLYWPDTLKHYDDAVHHLDRCVEVQKARLEAGGKVEAQYAEVFRALGDAHVKAKRFSDARQAWKQGLALFPDHPGLKARFTASDDEATAQVKGERGLTRRIDSGLGWLAGENGLLARESALRERPGDRQLWNAYRKEAFELDRIDDAIAFAQSALEQRPLETEPRLHLALALADRITLIGAATEEASRTALRLVSELESFTKASPGDWLGPYFTGICHLFRPPTKETGERALAAFTAADQLSRTPSGGARGPHVGLGLGDALVCVGQTENARKIWQETFAAFPHARALKKRLDAPVDGLRSLVRADYDLSSGIPTDLEELEDREGELMALEPTLKSAPTRELALRLRGLARSCDDPETAIRLLESAVKARPRSAILKVELALAYLDRIPASDLGSVRKGLLSSEALRQLEEVAAVHRGSWGLQYAIGLVHLHWFTKLKHVPFAIRAFERCFEIQKGHEKEHDYCALAYQALGDAHVKDRESPAAFPKARKIWKEGQDLFPTNRGLEERMGLTALMVQRFVEDHRSWASPIDTVRISAWIGDLPDLPGAEDVR